MTAVFQLPPLNIVQRLLKLIMGTCENRFLLLPVVITMSTFHGLWSIGLRINTVTSISGSKITWRNLLVVDVLMLGESYQVQHWRQL